MAELTTIVDVLPPVKVLGTFVSTLFNKGYVVYEVRLPAVTATTSSDTVALPAKWRDVAIPSLSTTSANIPFAGILYASIDASIMTLSVNSSTNVVTLARTSTTAPIETVVFVVETNASNITDNLS